MAGRRPAPPRTVAHVSIPEVEDETTQRALDGLLSAVQTLQVSRKRDYLEVSLVVGINRIPHGLGRPFLGFNLTRKTLNIAFDACISAEANPFPEREIWIDVTGSPEAVVLEVF